MFLHTLKTIVFLEACVDFFFLSFLSLVTFHEEIHSVQQQGTSAESKPLCRDLTASQVCQLQGPLWVSILFWPWCAAEAGLALAELWMCGLDGSWCSAGLRVWGVCDALWWYLWQGEGKRLLAGALRGVIRLQLMSSGRDGRPGPVGVLCSETHIYILASRQSPSKSSRKLTALCCPMPSFWTFASFPSSSFRSSCVFPVLKYLGRKVISHLESCQPQLMFPSSHPPHCLLYIGKSFQRQGAV